ncbi:MAG: hypothetical protein FJ295_06795 [Planctomycetes bacterium]|nr:hypothetical protein [Planctomycetota bacterium]
MEVRIGLLVERALSTRVDYQDFAAYLEMARSDCFSWFAEVPFRMLNPDLLDNTAGLSDVNFGIKYADRDT